MTQIKFEDQRLTPSADGKTVFFEATDNFQTKMGTSCRNTSVIRYDIEDGLLVHGTEYMNPVTAALTFGGKWARKRRRRSKRMVQGISNISGLRSDSGITARRAPK